MSNTRTVRIGATITLAMMVGTMLPYAVAVLAPLITRDLGISAADIGMFGTTTMLVATFAAPRAGLAVDRLGPRATINVLHGAFAVAAVTLAVSNGTAALLVGALVAGISLCLTNPVTNQVIVTQVRPGLRGVLTGIKQAGGQLSAMTAGLALPMLAGWWGWRTALLAFVVFAAAGIASTVTVPRLPRVPSSGAKPATASLSEGAERELRQLRLFGFLVAAGTGPMLYFLPLFVVDQFEASASLAGSTAAVGATIGTVARLSWGPITERLRRPVIALTIIGCASTVGMVLLAGATFVGLSLVWPAVVIIGASGLAFTTPAMLAIMRTVGPESTGAASGRFARSTYAGGVISPITFGWIIDATGSYRSAWIIAACLLAASAIVTLPRGKQADYLPER